MSTKFKTTYQMHVLVIQEKYSPTYLTNLNFCSLYPSMKLLVNLLLVCKVSEHYDPVLV